MDERLTDLFNGLSSAELDSLIGDLPLNEKAERKALKRLKIRVRRTRPGQRRGRGLRRAAAACAAAVLAVALLANLGLLTTAAQWTQSFLQREARPIQGFGENGRADFRDRRVDITTHTLLVSEEAEAVSYRVELSDLTFGEPPRWKGAVAPHAYIYLYVDGRTADFGELRAGEPLTLVGGPGTCLLVVVATVSAEITGAVTRMPGEVGP